MHYALFITIPPMPPRLLPLALAALLTACDSDHSPYAGMESRPIKALSAEQTAGYLAGEGMSLALAAELNGYPGPKHVLEFADDLQLTAPQRAAVEAMFADMRQEAITLGRAIVTQEKQLDALFAGQQADETSLRETVRHIAKLQGELRFAHLKWHLKTLPLLTPEQAERYDQLRGYHAGHHGH